MTFLTIYSLYGVQVSKDVLMMNLDGEFLEEVGAVTKAANLRKKEVQLNTRMHYTQRRCAHMPAPADTSVLIAAHLGLICSMPDPQASLCSV